MKNSSNSVVVILVGYLALTTFSVGMASNISGHIRDAATQLPIPNFDMNLYDANWNYVAIDANTGPQGIYIFHDVPAGNYYVKANVVWDQHYIAEYWDNAKTKAMASIIQVTDGHDVADKDFDLDYGNYITGRVLTQGGAPIADINVAIYDAAWNRIELVCKSDSSGQYYAGGLPAGSYYVEANAIYDQPYIDQYWNHAAVSTSATLVNLPANDDLWNIDFNLPSGTYIEGNVYDAATQAPLPTITIKVDDDQGNLMAYEGHPDANGHYVAGAFPAGRYIARADTAYPDGYVKQYYNQADSWGQATVIELQPPTPAANINFPLSQGSYVIGTVMDSHQSPILDMTVRFYDANWNIIDLAETVSIDGGWYLTGAIWPGRYFVRAKPAYPQRYMDQYFDHTDKDHAVPVEVRVGSLTQNINFSLPAGSYLLGSVTSAATGVRLYNMNLNLYDDQWNYQSEGAHSDDQGNYLIGPVLCGRYYLQCLSPPELDYAPMYYDNAFKRADAAIIDLSQCNEADGINFRMTTAGHISGQVQIKGEFIPIAEVTIELYTTGHNLAPVPAVTSRGDGVYVIYGISPGAYYVKATPPVSSSYSAVYYPESPDFDHAQTIDVLGGSGLSGIDFNLTNYFAPTPTPPVELGVTLELPSLLFNTGQVCYVNAVIGNPGQHLGELPLATVLDVYGYYYFWPSWNLYHPPTNFDFDYRSVTVESGRQVVQIIPAFLWPDTGGSAADGLYFYSSLLTSDFTALMGTMDTVQFGFAQ